MGAAEEFAKHLIDEHLDGIDATIVAQEGQIDAPESWELESVTYCNGKRIRTFRIAS